MSRRLGFALQRHARIHAPVFETRERKEVRLHTLTACLVYKRKKKKKKKKSVTVQSPHYKRVTSFSHLVLGTVGEIRGAYPTYPQDFPVYQDTANNICNLSSFRY